MTQFWLGSGASRYPGSICSCVAGAGNERLAKMLGMTSIRSIGSADAASIRCVPRLITCSDGTRAASAVGPDCTIAGMVPRQAAR